MTNRESASLAEKWIKPVAIKSCLKKLSLGFWVGSIQSLITLPPEILSGQNLTDIEIISSKSRGSQMNPISMTTSLHPVIKCVSLRRLRLTNVQISEEVLDEIFSVCKLLVDVMLSGCKGFRTIKVQNLHHLRKLRIDSGKQNGVNLEINGVPNIRVFMFEAKILPLNLNSLGSVTELSLGGMIMDDAFMHMIKSKLPFLQILTLDMKLSTLETFDFSCASMKSLSLLSSPITSVKVYAPKLKFFRFSGETMPSLLFPAAIDVLEQIKIHLSLMWRPMDDSFSLKMSEAFTLSSKCDVQIDCIALPLDIDLDDLRRRVPFPAMNVQRLLVRIDSREEGLWERSPFFDALFLICHPDSGACSR
ncbi:hypothetical protein LXL04_032951 [Taraxacum kok-saghyz]